MTEPLVLTVEEAAKLLRISRGSCYAAVRAREVPSVRLGRSIRVPRHAVLTLLGENGHENGESPAVTGLPNTNDKVRHAHFTPPPRW